MPFAGGVVAALAYEARHAIERTRPAPGEQPDAPRLVGAVYDAALSYDHRAGRWWLASWHLDDTALAALADEIRDAAADATRRPRPIALPAETSAITSSLDAVAYGRHVARIHEYIAAGDVYQVNLTQRFDTRLPAPPVDVYGRLRATQPVPFGAYLDLGRSACSRTRPSCSSDAAAPARDLPHQRDAPARRNRPPTPRSRPSSSTTPRSVPSTS